MVFLKKKRKRQKREKEKKWVQELSRKGQEKRVFNNLMQEMKLANTESFLSKI